MCDHANMEEVQGRLFCVVCGEVDQSVLSTPATTVREKNRSSKNNTSHHREEEWKCRMLTDREYLDRQVTRRDELEKAYERLETDSDLRQRYSKYLDWCFG